VSDDGAPISAADKSFPSTTWGWRAEEFADAHPNLADFPTPLVTLDASRIDHNIRVMADWCAVAGFLLAPHGKTTMSPVLWRRQLDAGAWGITLATAWQVQIARDHGIQRVLLANALVDPVALRWIAEELDAHPEFEFACWADSVATVELMDAVLAVVGGRCSIDVIVELGAPAGRTGARSVAEAREVADAVRASDRLRLAGCGGYEGAVAHDRGVDGLARVAAYLDSLVHLHDQLAAVGAYEVPIPIVTVGGSAYLDQVANRLAPVVGGATVLVRAGAYVIHDDGFYRDISPLDHDRFAGGLRSAMHGWARVVSRPEPELAILDGGKRDFPVDEGFPSPQLVLGLPTEESDALLVGASISAVNDQHSFLRLAPGTSAAALPVGAVIRLGLSHPCTALDKWRALPVIESLDSGVVSGFVRTLF